MTPAPYLALTSALVLTCVWGAVAGLRRAARRIDERRRRCCQKKGKGSRSAARIKRATS